MGCGGSKEEENPNKINSDFKWIGILRFDDFFRTAEGLLSRAETLRSGIEDSRDDGVELAGTWALKDGKYFDTAQVLFWAISANNEGQIKNASVEVTNDAPYITLDYRHLNRSTHDLFTTLETYLKTVAGGPVTIKEIIEKLQDMVTKLPDLVTEGKEEIKNSNLSFKGKADAVMNLTRNSNQLKNELPKCQKLAGLIDTAVADMKELLPKLKELLTTADEVGAKAHAANLTTPAEVFAKFHPGPRDPKAKDPTKKKEEKKKKDEEKKKKDEKKKKEGDKKEGEKKEGEKKEGEKKEGEKKEGEKKEGEKKEGEHKEGH